MLLVMAVGLAGCSSNPIDARPPTVAPAIAAASPPAAAAPAGRVLPLGGAPQSALFDPLSSSLAVFTPGPDRGEAPALTVFGPGGSQRTVPLPGVSGPLSGDGRGSVYAATRGGYVTADLAGGAVSRTAVPGHSDTDFTAIARRADGRMVLGDAGGTVYTLAADGTVSNKAAGFARIDALVTDGDIAVVLDSAQTSLTALGADGSRQQALRAGLGATTITADPAGRILVADTRAGQLLVFSVDPLIERQAYPVSDSPYGLAGSSTLVWVSQTATNTVIGYDLSTGIPVEKVRYPTVRQPNSLAFDEASGTLYVVSAAGAGVQVITGANGRR